MLHTFIGCIGMNMEGGCTQYRMKCLLLVLCYLPALVEVKYLANGPIIRSEAGMPNTEV
jgi:hypothetical protein